MSDKNLRTDFLGTAPSEMQIIVTNIEDEEKQNTGQPTNNKAVDQPSLGAKEVVNFDKDSAHSVIIRGQRRLGNVDVAGSAAYESIRCIVDKLRPAQGVFKV